MPIEQGDYKLTVEVKQLYTDKDASLPPSMWPCCTEQSISRLNRLPTSLRGGQKLLRGVGSIK